MRHGIPGRAAYRPSPSLTYVVPDDVPDALPDGERVLAGGLVELQPRLDQPDRVGQRRRREAGHAGRQDVHERRVPVAVVQASFLFLLG